MATPAPVRAMEYWLYQWKRVWRGSVASGFLNPLFYLAALGLGLGSLVDEGTANAEPLGGVDYVKFLAPGLLAAAAMQVAAVESTYPVMASIRWVRTYHAQLATPLEVREVLYGHLGYMALRILVSVVIFFAVMLLFGGVASTLAVAAIPAAVLTGMAFAAPLAAIAAAIESESVFATTFRLGIMPMFLFSGTFFPVSELPAALQPVAYATPLWHGVDLCRSLALDDVDLTAAAVHVAYLGILAVGGVAFARRAFRTKLVR